MSTYELGVAAMRLKEQNAARQRAVHRVNQLLACTFSPKLVARNGANTSTNAQSVENDSETGTFDRCQ
jgi:hypothetical protein